MMTDKGVLITQPSGRPTRKLAAAGVSGAATTLLLWALDSLGIALDAEVAAAITTAAMGIAGYMTRERASARR
jgi:hypothetical protein